MSCDVLSLTTDVADRAVWWRHLLAMLATGSEGGTHAITMGACCRRARWGAAHGDSSACRRRFVLRAVEGDRNGRTSVGLLRPKWQLRDSGSRSRLLRRRREARSIQHLGDAAAFGGRHQLDQRYIEGVRVHRYPVGLAWRVMPDGGTLCRRGHAVSRPHVPRAVRVRGGDQNHGVLVQSHHDVAPGGGAAGGGRR